MITVTAVLNAISAQLASATIEAPRIEARVLLEHALNVNRAWLLGHSDQELSASEVLQIERLLTRRLNDEPLAYLTGEREFYGLRFKVTPSVLIPRPETEILVERALRALHGSPEHAPSVVDVGTGSGAIAVAIAARAPMATVVAIDRSLDALRVARDNAERNGIRDRIRFVQSDLLSGTRIKADLILANLPYIPSGRMSSLPGDVRSEPALALDGGSDGLDLIRQLIEQAPTALYKGGRIILECDPEQMPAVREIIAHHLPAAAIEVFTDSFGHERIIEAT